MGGALLTAGCTTGLVFLVSCRDQVIQLVKHKGDLFVGNFTPERAVFSDPALEHAPEQELNGFRRVPVKKVGHDLLQERLG